MLCLVLYTHRRWSYPPAESCVELCEEVLHLDSLAFELPPLLDVALLLMGPLDFAQPVSKGRQL